MAAILSNGDELSLKTPYISYFGASCTAWTHEHYKYYFITLLLVFKRQMSYINVDGYWHIFVNNKGFQNCA